MILFKHHYNATAAPSPQQLWQLRHVRRDPLRLVLLSNFAAERRPGSSSK